MCVYIAAYGITWTQDDPEFLRKLLSDICYFVACHQQTIEVK